ncbi:TerD family protein [Tenacibaculum finnmarkense genomovar ulcerans]|nr:TerD family protein [Tenacibaculum finnmarkense genomovar ulcerans]MCD8422888.1 TerD family protein [Tenacibaculum finnmarkense genomovar ulcerans]MCD8432784.1 TerD family protein [Tenacibaculum finnmarkense genomovar ulcerans]MCG8238893.1 TerD family protein [Tenacibaculum finnmarkense genomovar ulcerans]
MNLKKGQQINLTKKPSNGNVSKLTKFCVGVNWGAIEGTYIQREKKGGFLGFGGKEETITKKFTEAVDLDASCGLFDVNGNLIDTIYYGQLNSKDSAINHSGDDREGDLDGDDGLDNEIISVDLSRVNTAVKKIVFFLNSYKKQDFSRVPFATIRLYEGTAEKVIEVFATYNVAADITYKNCVSMIMGALHKENGEWKFDAIGAPSDAKDLKETLLAIRQTHL